LCTVKTGSTSNAYNRLRTMGFLTIPSINFVHTHIHPSTHSTIHPFIYCQNFDYFQRRQQPRRTTKQKKNHIDAIEDHEMHERIQAGSKEDLVYDQEPSPNDDHQGSMHDFPFNDFKSGEFFGVKTLGVIVGNWKNTLAIKAPKIPEGQNSPKIFQKRLFPRKEKWP